MAVIRQEERLFNLVVALMATRNGLTKAEIFSSVRGFVESWNPADTSALDRQFERDKKFLRGFGITIDVHDDPALSDNQSQRYRIERAEYEFPPGVTFTPEELYVMSLAGAVWRQGSLSTAAQFAVTKLKGLGVELEAGGDLGPVRIVVNEPNVEALTEFSAERATVEFHYHAAGYDSAARVIVVPVEVFLHHERWHVFAWNVSSAQFRTYLVSRITDSVTRLRDQRPADMPTPPPLSSVITELEELWDNNVAEVTVEPGSEAAVRLSRRAQNPGEPRLFIHFTDEALLADELTSYGPEVEVMAPLSLREAVISRLRSLSAWSGEGA